MVLREGDELTQWIAMNNEQLSEPWRAAVQLDNS